MNGPFDYSVLKEAGFYVDHCLIKPKANEIVVEGQKHRVRQKLIEVLAYMAANAGETVSRDEILQQIWSAKPSSDEVLTQVISELRKVLNVGSGGETVIETIPKVGYRLTAVVRLEAIQPRSFGSVAPAVLPTADHLDFYNWAESLARQNRLLWVAVAVLILAFVSTSAVLFGLGPYREEVFIQILDGETITSHRRGFGGQLEEKGPKKDEN